MFSISVQFPAIVGLFIVCFQFKLLKNQAVNVQLKKLCPNSMNITLEASYSSARARSRPMHPQRPLWENQ